MLFGRKAPQEKTFLLLDIESGSVGSALVRTSTNAAPKLFGEKRVSFRVENTLGAAALAKKVEAAAHQALSHTAEVASRVRQVFSASKDLSESSHIANTAIFLSPPWGKPNLAAGKPDFLTEMQQALRRAVRTRSESPAHFYTAAAAVAHGSRIVHQEPMLLCIVGGEVTELLLIDGKVLAHATLPTGTHALVRTLRTHGGLSEHEARSAMRLPFSTARLREPFRSASEHFAEHFTDGAADLFSTVRPTKIFVVAREGAGDWYAQALAAQPEDALYSLFPQGGEVRAFHARHFTPHLSSHSNDLLLSLQALFVDNIAHTQVR